MFALVAFRTGGFEIAFREKPTNEDLLLHPEVFTEEEEGSITAEDEQRIAIVVLLCSFDVLDKVVFFLQTITVVAISVNKIIYRTIKVI